MPALRVVSVVFLLAATSFLSGCEIPKVYRGTEFLLPTCGFCPYVQPNAVTLAEDQANALVTVTVTDTDSSVVTLAVNTTTPNGTLTCPTAATTTAGNLTAGYTFTFDCTYTSNLNYNGPDSFDVVATDNATPTTSSSQITTISLTVTPVNDAPVWGTGPATMTFNEDTPTTFTVTATDVDGPNVTFAPVTAPTKGTVSCAAPTVAGTTYTSVCTYTPTLNQNGADSFTIRASDGTLTSAVSTVAVSITPVNDAPVITAAPAISTLEDTAGISTLSVTDVDGVAPTVTVTGAPAKGGAACGTATVVTATSWTYACTFTPTLNLSGNDSFIVQVSDGVVFLSTTIGVTIAAVNDAPVWGTNPASITFNEDTPATFTVTATDVDGPFLTFAPVTLPTKGTITCAASTVAGTTYTSVCTFSPTLNQNGANTFTMRASDGTLTSATSALITANITAVNDAPVWGTNPATMTLNEDTPTTFTVTATDVDGPALTFAPVTLPTKGTITCAASTVVGTTYTSVCTFTPTLNQNGANNFTMRASDGLLTSATSALITVTITAVNDAPTITGTPITQAFNSGVAQTRTLANMGLTVTDPDVATNGDVLTYTIAGQPTGTLATVAFAVGAGTGTITGTASGLGTVSPELYTVTLTVKDTALVAAAANVPFSVTDVTPPASHPFVSGYNDSGTANVYFYFDPSPTADFKQTNVCLFPTGAVSNSACTGATGAAFLSGVTTSSITGVANGSYTAWFYAFDEAMNASAVSSDPVVVGPTVTATLPQTTALAASNVIGQASYTTATTGTTTSTMSNTFGQPMVYRGMIYIPDSYNSRILVYKNMPTTIGAAASFVVGLPYQPMGLTTNGTQVAVTSWSGHTVYLYNSFPVAAGNAVNPILIGNGIAGCSATQLNSPYGARLSGTTLYVADSANNRVLKWNSLPTVSGTAPNVVYGQGNFTSCLANQGLAAPSATTLSKPADVYVHTLCIITCTTWVYIADYTNSRVLRYTNTATTADMVVGQAGFTTSTISLSATGMNWPNAIYIDGALRFFVVDSANNRVLVWNALPGANGAAANWALGQPNLTTGTQGTTQTTMKQPAGITLFENKILVDDYRNARYMVW